MMKKILFFGLTILFAAMLAVGQTTTGRLTGTVNGPDGVLPNATITAKDMKTGKEFTASSNEDGSFLFPQLEFGAYTVTISAQGFKTFVANEVKIDVGRDYSLNPTLEIGNIQESVTVTAGADVVTSTTSQISNTISPQQIVSIPLLERNPLNLITLQAGTAQNSFQLTSINGLRTSHTNITRDGINIQDAFIRSNATDFAPGRPSVDDTGEFTITASNQEADQGGGGAQIRLVTPRGTSDFHGGLFAYNRNSAFAANKFFSNRSGLARPFRNRNQFGGKLSGPLPMPNFGEGGAAILKDKGFFFFAYEGIRDPVSTFRTRTILTPAARTGAFSFNRAAAGNPINSGGLSCPSGAVGSVCTVTNILQFANSLGFANIPLTIDPVVQARVIDKLPTASNFTGGDGLNTAGYSLNRADDTERNTYTARFDVDATERDSFNFVYSWVKNTSLRSDADTTQFTVVPGVNQYSLNKTYVGAYRRIFSSNIVNEVRGGVFLSEVPFDRTDPKPTFFFNSPATTGTINSQLVALLVHFPENTFLSQGRKNKSYNFQDNVDWAVGKHSFRFGGQLQYFQVNTYNEAGTVPAYRLGTGPNTPSFSASNFANSCTPSPCASNATSLISTTQLATANNLMALLGGIINAGVQTFNAESPTSGFLPQASFFPYRYANHSLYAMDRWSIARGLTLTLGLRYEVYPALRLENGLSLEPVITDPNNFVQSLLDPNGRFQILGGNAGKENAYYKTDYNNFAPSFGVAYTPNFESGIGKFLFGGEGKSVIRGGYSQAYVNDSILTALSGANGSNVGLGSTTSNAVLNGSTNLNARLSGTLPAINAPVFAGAPTYLFNNSPSVGGNVGNISAVDPNLQIPKVEQYSFGIQREFFGNTALEIRYVGSRSKSLIRAIDYNQIDIFGNGILADFNRALNNDRLTGNPFCTAADNAGCVPLQIFQQSAGTTGRLGVAPTTASTPAGTLSRATFLNNLRNGAVADLARLYVSGGLNNHPTVANPTATPFVRIMPNPASGTSDILLNGAFFNYNSLQVEVRRRFDKGLYLQANYTFAKNLTDSVGTTQALFDFYLDNNNTALDKQRADFDQTHTFNLNGIYQLPFGKGKMFLNQGGAADYLLGGWELAGSMQWTSGAPITFTDTRGTLNRTARSIRQTANTTLTNDEIRALAGIFEENGNIYYINPAVLLQTQNANGTYSSTASRGFGQPAFNGQVFFNTNPGETGNMARAVLDGPGYFNINASLMKNFRFGENMRLQLRAEAFNLLNNVNYSFATAAEQKIGITSTTFGQVTDTTAARTMQFAFRFEF